MLSLSPFSHAGHGQFGKECRAKVNGTALLSRFAICLSISTEVKGRVEKNDFVDSWWSDGG